MQGTIYGVKVKKYHLSHILSCNLSLSYIQIVTVDGQPMVNGIHAACHVVEERPTEQGRAQTQLEKEMATIVLVHTLSINLAMTISAHVSL